MVFTKHLAVDSKLNDIKTINIADYRRDLKLPQKINFPNNLCLIRRTHTPTLYASWMPSQEDDPRPVKSGKRRPLQASTGHIGVREAALSAITWCKDKQRELIENYKELVDIKETCLSNYWEIYFENFCKTNNNLSRTKQIRDEKNKWFSPKYGLSKEAFSHIKANEISRQHLEDYMQSLSVGMQGQQKTLLKKLFVFAEKDFIGHQFPSFPKITGKQKQQVTHFEFDQWELLMKTINDLSNGAARSDLTYSAYKELEFNPFNRKNQKNWVDLFDALWVNYYWFLRSQDVQRIKIDWFAENKKDQEFILTNPDPKSARKIENTISMKNESYSFLKRLLKRRKKSGYLIMPDEKRQSEGGQENKVSRNLNFLLKEAVKICLPNFNLEECDLTTVRHTSFRHHLEDDPTLGQYPKIVMFAKNGLTSPDMLQKTYIDYISREKTLKESRKKMRSSSYSLVKKVEF